MGRTIIGLCVAISVAALVAIPEASAGGRHGYHGHKGHYKHHGRHYKHGRRHYRHKKHHYRRHGRRHYKGGHYKGHHYKGHHGKHHYGYLALPLIHLFAYGLSSHSYGATDYYAAPAPRYRRPCHRVVKDAYDAYGAPVLLGGTMCYDAYGRGYIVRGSRHIVRYY